MELSLFVLVLALAFANGTNDVSKAIATLVGSGITNYQTAIVWGTVWTVFGACVSGVVASAMVKTSSSGLIAPGTAVKRRNPKQVREIADLESKDIVIMNRESGSGARDLLDRRLRGVG